MLPLAALLLATQGDHVGTQSAITMPIYKRVMPEWGTQKRRDDGQWTAPMAETTVNVGQMTWSVENAKFKDAPCKLYRVNSSWESPLFVNGIRTKKKVKPILYFFAWVSPEGKLLKTNSSLAGIGNPVQIDAIYKPDSVDLTITVHKQIRSTTLYPSFPLERFSNLFVPMIEDGLVKQEKKEIALIHPQTGLPVTVDLKLTKRFQAKFMNLPFEGHYVEATSAKSLSTLAISRQGQLLAVSTPDGHEANAYIPLTRDEEEKWGKFKAADWELPASITHPNRRRHKTLVVPVLLNDPRIFMPIPCVIAL